MLQIFFNPEIYSNDFITSLPAVIDKCIQSAPIDTRRALYKVRNTRFGQMYPFCVYLFLVLMNL